MARTTQQTHDAGRHFAVAEALMRGYQAAVVGSRSLIEVNGHRSQVQVAAKGSWQIDDVDKYTYGSIECFVLVDLTDGLRDFYICPGDQLRSDVRKRYDEFVASNGGKRPRNPDSKHAAIYPEDVRKWGNDWNRLA